MNRRSAVGPAREAAQPPSFNFSFAQEGNSSGQRLQRMASYLPADTRAPPHTVTTTPTRPRPFSRSASSSTQKPFAPTDGRPRTGFGGRRAPKPMSMSQPAPAQPPSPISTYDVPRDQGDGEYNHTSYPTPEDGDDARNRATQAPRDRLSGR